MDSRLCAYKKRKKKTKTYIYKKWQKKWLPPNKKGRQPRETYYGQNTTKHTTVKEK